MILNKKGFMMLPLAALLFATSCAKKISYEQALEIAKNYSTEPIPIKKLSVNFSVDAKNDATKDSIRTLAEMLGIEKDLKESGDNFKYEGEIPVEEEDYAMPITADQLPNPEDYKEIVDMTYLAKGNSLSLDLHAEIKSDTQLGSIMTIHSANIKGSAGVNDKGYPTNASIKLDLDATVNMPVSTFNEGSDITLNFVNGEISVTATY